MFWKEVASRTLPKKNGKTIQFYRAQELGANPVPANEGDVGTGISLCSTTLQATVAQYCDFMSFSDLLVDTAIDGDVVAVGADKLGYRAGLTFDTINRNEVDANAASVDVPLLADYPSGMDLAGLATRLDGLDIQPMANGFYQVLMHPYVRYDFIHDRQVGGFIDLEKPGSGENQDALYDTAGGNGGFIARLGGCEIWASTNVTQASTSPSKWRTYIFGAEALGAIDLAGRAHPVGRSEQAETLDPRREQHRPHGGKPGRQGPRVLLLRLRLRREDSRRESVPVPQDRRADFARSENKLP